MSETPDTTNVAGEYVESDTAGTGPAVNAGTGQVTQPGEQLPPVPDTTRGSTPLKKARKRARKAPAKKADKVTIFLVGSSHGGNDGDRRQVDPERAEELVRSRAARYPASAEKPRRPAFLR